MKVEFSKHNLTQSDITEVVNVLNSLFITTASKTKEFEEKFAQILMAKHCAGVNSATAGLHLLLKSIGVTEGDEVITTPLSFVATANVIEYCGAKAIFADVDLVTGLISVEAIENAITENTKAVIAVHLYGNMVDMVELKKLCDKRGLYLIEDAAHCVEGERDSVVPGEFSIGAAFSFYATKNITSGEGGAVVTNNSDIANKLYTLRLHGLNRSAENRYGKHVELDMEVPGYKYNMFDIQAALLVNQLGKLDENLKKREHIALTYERFFNEAGLDYPMLPPNCKSARHLAVVYVDALKRDEIIKKMQERGVGVSVHFKPIHLMSWYKKKGFKEGDFPNAENISSRSISLPIYPKLTQQEQEYVIDSLKQSVI